MVKACFSENHLQNIQFGFHLAMVLISNHWTVISYITMSTDKYFIFLYCLKHTLQQILAGESQSIKSSISIGKTERLWSPNTGLIYFGILGWTETAKSYSHMGKWLSRYCPRFTDIVRHFHFKTGALASICVYFNWRIFYIIDASVLRVLSVTLVTDTTP